MRTCGGQRPATVGGGQVGGGLVLCGPPLPPDGSHHGLHLLLRSCQTATGRRWSVVRCGLATCRCGRGTPDPGEGPPPRLGEARRPGSHPEQVRNRADQEAPQSAVLGEASWSARVAAGVACTSSPPCRWPPGCAPAGSQLFLSSLLSPPWHLASPTLPQQPPAFSSPGGWGGCLPFCVPPYLLIPRASRSGPLIWSTRWYQAPFPLHLLADLEGVIAMVQEGVSVLEQTEAVKPVVEDAGVLHGALLGYISHLTTATFSTPFHMKRSGSKRVE